MHKKERDESFVKRNWNKNPYECHQVKSENFGRPEVTAKITARQRKPLIGENWQNAIHCYQKLESNEEPASS